MEWKRRGSRERDVQEVARLWEDGVAQTNGRLEAWVQPYRPAGQVE